ncbi:MAG: hypothetical protein HYV28_13825, partial [Ignavibacteriales bacterium]|nr:hypothetical protein [Ignavibacteriales bacterium]
MKSLVLAFLLVTGFSFAGTVTVIFKVNMAVQMQIGNFIPNDPLVVRGNFQVDAGDLAGNWQGNVFTLTDTDNDSVFSVAAQFPDTKIGTIYNFKFVMHEVWESSPNHTFTLENLLTQNLPIYYFANDSIVFNIVTNTIKFTADLTGIYGSGPSFFDPNNDSLFVSGFFAVSGNSRLFEVPNPPRRFKTTLTVKGYLGDSVKWKYRAFPLSHFNNNGWELGEDRWFTYQADSSVVILPETKPEFTVVSTPLTTDVTVLFVCNMNHNAVNRYTGLLIPI